MHRAEHGANLRNLSGQEGQNQRDGEVQRGVGQFLNVLVHGRLLMRDDYG